jgi:hypothetical protein
VQVGYLPLSAEEYNPTAIQLSDAHACLIFSETNLFMTVDIGTPGSPAVSGTYTFSGPVRNMSVDNGRAYLLAADQRYGSSDLHLLDISDPAIIVSLGRLYAHGSAVHLAAGTNVLILADSQNGLCLLGTESPALSVIGHLPGEVRTFAVDNNRVYAGRSDGLEIYDISLPESPVSVTNHYEPATHIAVGDDYLYRIGGWGMPELVISDKTDNLNELHRLSWIEGINQIRSFDMVNDLYALMVDDFAGNMVIINVQDPALPVLTNYYATAPIMDVAKRIDMGGTNALLATTNGIEVLDLSGEPPFQVVGSWDCPEGRTPRSLCVDGDRIAVSSIDHVWILDSTQFSGGDPLVADTSIGHAVSHMLLSGNRLYVAAGAEGIIVYEIDTETGGPMLHVTRSTSNRIELEWDAAGFGWQVQHIEDLTSSNGWLTLPGTDAMTATNLDTALPRQFFRLMK